MDVITSVLGNIKDPEWHEKLHHCHVETIYLDQWTAQKSRFLGKSDHGNEYPIALARNTHAADGDVVVYDEAEKKAVVIGLLLNQVLVVDLSKLAEKTAEEIIHISVELGHAIGNQHWPAVVKGTRVYVPLTVDKKVMLSVLDTHNIPEISYQFEEGQDVIPFLAPGEVRNLFGGASHESHAHTHDHGHIHR